jgi:hypothetical protein
MNEGMDIVRFTRMAREFLGDGEAYRHNSGAWVFNPSMMPWEFRFNQSPSGEWAGHLWENPDTTMHQVWSGVDADLANLMSQAPSAPERQPAKPQATPQMVLAALEKRPELLRQVVTMAITNGSVTLVRAWEDGENGTDSHRYILDEEGTCAVRVCLERDGHWKWQLRGQAPCAESMGTIQGAKAAADIALMEAHPSWVQL